MDLRRPRRSRRGRGRSAHPGRRALLLPRRHARSEQRRARDRSHLGRCSAARRLLAAVIEHGAGRVVVLSDSDLFGDDCIGALDHEALWVNLAYWAAAPSFGRPEESVPSGAAADPAWLRLRDAVEELRVCRRRTARSPRRAATRRASASCASRSPPPPGARSEVPHQPSTSEALGADLRAWADGGFGKPDFIRSVEVYRPEQGRRDGIEHLVVFPMYKQERVRLAPASRR